VLSYLLISAFALTLSLFVYSRNVSAPLHKYYMMFTLWMVVWLSGSVVASTPDALFELHFRLIFVAAVLMSYFLLMFISEIARKAWSPNFKFLLFVVGLVLSCTSVLTDLITVRVYVDTLGTVQADRGPLYAIAVAWVSMVGITGVPVLAARLRDKSMDRLTRQQLNVVFVTLTFAVVTAVTTSAILPYLTSDLSYIGFSSFASLIFSSGFAYAILRLKLFNLKAVAARGFVYVLALWMMVIVYSASTTLLAPLLTGKVVHVTGAEFISSIVTTLILVIFYPTVKKTFDKVTNKIFFRDTYDAQAFLDELNKILVKNIDIDVLLEKSCYVIEKHIRADHVGFYVRDTPYYDSRMIGTYDKSISSADAKMLETLLPKVKKKVIYVDQFEKVDSPAESQARQILRANNIEVLIRIVSTLEYEVSGIGYLILGQKKSGNMYDQQDLKMMEILSNELELAIENALRFEEIQQFNVTLQDKIEDATKQLKRNNEKLKELDQAKDEFVSMASHQLRTPLTAVKGYISMLQDGDAGKTTSEQKKMLGAAMLSSQRMVHLIADLLNVSRIKTKKFVINAQATDLPLVVASEIGQLKDGARTKKIKIHYTKPKRFPALSVDEVKMRQVIMNFIDNAIYYTHEKGEITIELKNRIKSVEFTVTDSGIGVPKAEQHKLFTKFYRAGNAKKARPDGTGLGLYMAKKVVKAQGGDLIFKSVEGKGSTFGFRLHKNKIKVLDK